MPIGLLEKSLNKSISILLKDGRELEGVLTGYDEYMNLVLNDAADKKEGASRKLGIIVIRGNNIVRISSL